MKHQEKITTSAAATFALGEVLGSRMPAGAVIAASGNLGAGKTVFAAGLAAGLGIKAAITSPTFIFFNDYAEGRVPFCHLDAYRLEDLEEEEIALIGVDDCFGREKAVLVEWPQYVAPWLPPNTVQLEIVPQADVTRRLIFEYPESEGWLDEALSD